MTRAAPPGFDLEPLNGGFLLLRAGGRDAALGKSLRWGGWEEAIASRYSGRGSAGVLSAGGERYVVRRYRHGGLLRWFTGERYAGPGRAFREAALYDELHRRGVPTLEAVGVLAERRALFGFRLALFTREEARAEDLVSFFLKKTGGRDSAPVARSAGEAVRRLHEAGFRHADLHLKNLLVVPGDPPAVLVIDLDRGAFVSPLPAAVAKRSLARLYRSLRRLEESGGGRLARATDLVRFLRAYAGAPWKPLAREVLSVYRRSLPAHRIGWFLERLFSGRRFALAAPRP